MVEFQFGNRDNSQKVASQYQQAGIHSSASLDQHQLSGSEASSLSMIMKPRSLTIKQTIEEESSAHVKKSFLPRDRHSRQSAKAPLQEAKYQRLPEDVSASKSVKSWSPSIPSRKQ